MSPDGVRRVGVTCTLLLTFLITDKLMPSSLLVSDFVEISRSVLMSRPSITRRSFPPLFSLLKEN